MSETTEPSRDEQLAWELARRQRVAVLAAGAGFLYVLSTSILSAVLKSAPSVGVLQGLAPALQGVASPTISPGAAEVRFIHTHSFGTIAGSVIAAVAVVFAVVALTFLERATRYRRPQSLRATRLLLIVGGGGFAALSIAHEVINAIETAKFVHGHNFSDAAVEHALTTNTPTAVLAAIGPLVAIAFGVGVGVASVNAMRVGLVPRMLGYVGVACAILFVLPVSQTLELLIALWLVGLGFLLYGRWPGGDPPAWESGESRPWPTAAERRLAAAGAGGTPEPPRRGLFGGRGSRDAASGGAAVVEAPPEPTVRQHSRSNKRKRRRER